MTSVFTALLPSSGESFLLETEHDGARRVVLVDAGRANFLREAIETKKHGNTVKRIAICTHADNDHSGGFPNFIKSWYGKSGKTIGEIWLPAAWAIVDEYLKDEMPNLPKRLRSGAEASAEMCFADGEHRQERVFRRDGSLVKNMRDAIEQYLEDAVNLDTRISRKGGGEIAVHPTDVSEIARLLYAETKKTADLIARIIKSARDYKIKIRWFDFAPFKRRGCVGGGEPGFLIPRNSVEGRPQFRRNNTVMFAMLYLTMANRESLTFQRVEDKHEPGVLFLADSELAIRDNNGPTNFFAHSETESVHKMQRPCIYTAPHHGSHNNDYAYEALESWLGPDMFKRSIAVKNGGVWNQKAGKFKHLCNRVCARGYEKFCGQQPFKQTMQIKTCGIDWHWPPAQVCPCQGHPCRP